MAPLYTTYFHLSDPVQVVSVGGYHTKGCSVMRPEAHWGVHLGQSLLPDESSAGNDTDPVLLSTGRLYRYQNHRSSYMALRSTARRFGFQVSLLIRLTRQETSPFGPFLTLRLHWQLVIRDPSGHAISLSCLTAGLSGKVMTLIACVFIWGSS